MNRKILGVPSIVQADKSGFWGKSKYHKFIKNLKNRLERRKAKLDPECPPTYKFYRGYET